VRWWVARDGRRLEVSVKRDGDRSEVTIDGRKHVVELVPLTGELAALLSEDGRTFAVAGRQETRSLWRISLGDRDFQVHLRDPLERELAGIGSAASGPQEVRAPIPGKVVSVAVSPGQRVDAGQPLVVLEAMKMENQICAEGAGEIEAVLVSPGTTVEGGHVLVVIR
jgi:3-methylcrotonyl-CoA carboxylase alpha subunit